MEELCEELVFNDGTIRIQHSGNANDEPAVSTPLRTFRFNLCRKPVQLGALAFDHWWMNTATLYGQRNRPSPNQDSVIECWWAICMQRATVFDDAIEESYILAKLLPHARSNGSRKVFVDCHPTRQGGRKELAESVATLDKRLAEGRDEQMDKLEFRNRTADCLGPPIYPQEVQDRYFQLSAELLAEAKEALQSKGPSGLNVPFDRWKQWMNSIGRHRGHELEKQVLDALSYECRTALHRCYSLVWCLLISHLQQKYAISPESAAFHAFWHLDQCEPSAQPDLMNFHLFHGHVFALHPACGTFMLTQTGCELLGDWLTVDSTATYQRLLHGLYVAMDHYAQRNQVYALLRRGEGRVTSMPDMVAIEEQMAEERSGRRRHRRRRTDAR